MTNKEAIAILKEEKEFLYNGDNCYNAQAFDLAIKALEVVDDVNHTVYRNENCKKAGRCYDYFGYHCAGCKGEY